MRTLARLMIIGLALTCVEPAAARHVCVSNYAVDPFREEPCASCRNQPIADPCFNDIGTALNATGPGDYVLIDGSTYCLTAGACTTAAVVNGQHVIGLGNVGVANVGMAVPALTVYRGKVENVLVISTVTGVPGIDVYLEKTRCEAAGDCNVTFSNVGCTSSASGRCVRVYTTQPVGDPEWQVPGNFGQVVFERLSGDRFTFAGTINVNHLELDGKVVFTCRECFIDVRGPGSGVNVLRSLAPLTSLVNTRFLRTFSDPSTPGPPDRWGLQRLCDKRLDLVDLRPIASGAAAATFREVPNGSCAGDTWVDVSGIDGPVTASPNAVASFRGSVQPFACPGTTANANPIGSRWYDTAVNVDRVCTPLGWKSLVFSP